MSPISVVADTSKHYAVTQGPVAHFPVTPFRKHNFRDRTTIQQLKCMQARRSGSKPVRETPRESVQNAFAESFNGTLLTNAKYQLFSHKIDKGKSAWQYFNVTFRRIYGSPK